MEQNRKSCTKCGSPTVEKLYSKRINKPQAVQLEQNKIPRRWDRIVVAGAKGLAKNLLLSALVMGPGLLIISQQQLLGWLWMLLGSFAMMAWSYRNEWRLNWVSCLVPPLMAAASYIVQLIVFGGNPNLIGLGLAAIVGLAVGIARGGTHKVYGQSGGIYAKRLTGYLLVWLVCYLISQFFNILGRQEALQIGRITGAFSTVMLSTVAIVLLKKYTKQKTNIGKILSEKSAVGLFFLFFICAGYYVCTSSVETDASSHVSFQVPSDIFDTPMPPSPFMATVTYVNGCSVHVEIRTPPSNGIGRYTIRHYNTTVKNYCRNHPTDYMLCKECIQVGQGRIDKDNKDAATAAIIASILILIGGITVNVANAVAEAIRQATEAAAEAVSQSAVQSVTGATVQPTSTLAESESAEPPPPLYDSYGAKLDQHGDLYGWYDRWVTRAEAEGLIAQELAERNRERAPRLAEHDRRAEQDWEDLTRRNREEAAEAERAWAEERARREHIDDLLRRGRGMISQVDDPVRAQQLEDFIERRKNDPAELERAVAAIRSQTYEADQQQTMGESEAAQAEASELERSERTAANIQNAAKAGIAVTGGAMVTAGATAASAMAAAAAATGAIGGAEAGSESYLRGDNLVDAARNVAAATAIGTADGALAVGTNIPGTGMGVRMAGSFGQGLTAAAEQLRRGRDAGDAALHGTISFVGGVAGQAVNVGIGDGLVGEAVDAGVAAAEGGLHSSADGGTFAEGAQQGMEEWIVGKAGGSIAGRAAQHASDYGPTPSTIARPPVDEGETDSPRLPGEEGGAETSRPPVEDGETESTRPPVDESEADGEAPTRDPSRDLPDQELTAGATDDPHGMADDTVNVVDFDEIDGQQQPKSGEMAPDADSGAHLGDAQSTTRPSDEEDGALIGDEAETGPSRLPGEDGDAEGTDPNSGTRNVDPNEIGTATEPVPEPKPESEPPDLSRPHREPPIIDPETEGYMPGDKPLEGRPGVDDPEPPTNRTQQDTPERGTREPPSIKEGVPDGMDPESSARVLDPMKVRSDPDFSRPLPDPPIVDPEYAPMGDDSDVKPSESIKSDDSSGATSEGLPEGFEPPKQEIPEIDPLAENIGEMESGKVPEWTAGPSDEGDGALPPPLIGDEAETGPPRLPGEDSDAVTSRPPVEDGETESTRPPVDESEADGEAPTRDPSRDLPDQELTAGAEDDPHSMADDTDNVVTFDEIDGSSRDVTESEHLSVQGDETQPSPTPLKNPDDLEIQKLDSRRQALAEGRDRLPDEDLRRQVNTRIAVIDQQIKNRDRVIRINEIDERLTQMQQESAHGSELDSTRPDPYVERNNLETERRTIIGEHYQDEVNTTPDPGTIMPSGLDGVHAHFDITAPGNAPTPQQAVAAADTHVLNPGQHEGGDPYKSWSVSYDSAVNAPNSGQSAIAMADIPADQLLKGVQSGEVVSVDYAVVAARNNLTADEAAKLGTEREVSIHDVPRENWRIIADNPEQQLSYDDTGPLAGVGYYREADGSKVYRVFRGLTSLDLKTGEVPIFNQS